MTLISHGVPPLEGVKQRWDGKNKSLYTHTAVAPRALTWR